MYQVTRHEPSGVTNDTDNVTWTMSAYVSSEYRILVCTSAKVKVLVLERRGALGDLLRLSHDLDLDALGADIVEEELVAGGTLVVDTGTNTDDLGLVALAGLEVSKVTGELAQIVVGYIRVRFVPSWSGMVRGTYCGTCGGRGWETWSRAACSSPVSI